MAVTRLRPSLARLPSPRLLGTGASRTAKRPELLSAALSFQEPGAFRVKSLGELLRALAVFRLCSYPALVNNCAKVRVESVSFLLLGGKLDRSDRRVNGRRRVGSCCVILALNENVENDNGGGSTKTSN